MSGELAAGGRAGGAGSRAALAANSAPAADDDRRDRAERYRGCKARLPGSRVRPRQTLRVRPQASASSNLAFCAPTSGRQARDLASVAPAEVSPARAVAAQVYQSQRGRGWRRPRSAPARPLSRLGHRTGVGRADRPSQWSLALALYILLSMISSSGRCQRAFGPAPRAPRPAHRGARCPRPERRLGIDSVIVGRSARESDHASGKPLVLAREPKHSRAALVRGEG